MPTQREPAPPIRPAPPLAGKKEPAGQGWEERRERRRREENLSGGQKGLLNFHYTHTVDALVVNATKAVKFVAYLFGSEAGAGDCRAICSAQGRRMPMAASAMRSPHSGAMRLLAAKVVS